MRRKEQPDESLLQGQVHTAALWPSTQLNGILQRPGIIPMLERWQQQQLSQKKQTTGPGSQKNQTTGPGSPNNSACPARSRNDP